MSPLSAHAGSDSDPYRDPDLVTLYDSDNPAGPDHAYYRALADRLRARLIIDLGCGTGLLTRSLAGPGRTVIGVDPSATMLDYARQQPGADAVEWVHGDATALPPRGDADLVVCTGNAIQHVDPDELPDTLRRTASTLRPGGVVAFESRNPAAREWERWTPEATMGTRQTPFGQLTEWLEVTQIDEDRRVVFDAHNMIDGRADRVFASVLYFRTADRFTHELHAAGFVNVRITGNWDDGPVTESSRILVVQATRP